MKTLIVVNPRAANGRATRAAVELTPLLRETFGELDIVTTHNPAEVTHHLEQASANEIGRVISVGGDGTNHAIINALAGVQDRQPGPAMAYGTLPVGTGRDWARGLGMPIEDLPAAVRWLGEAQPQPTDVGLLTYDGKQEHFLNIGSAGISYDIVHRVNDLVIRRPWSFLQATIQTLLTHTPRRMRITLDGQMWYDGPAYVAVVANGSMFAHGMNIAPGADIRDGQLDVVLVEGASRGAILTALPRVYSGTHLTHPSVRVDQARQVDVRSDGELGVELDGEPFRGRDLSFTVRPRLLNVLSK